jgi:hypothetical protein
MRVVILAFVGGVVLAAISAQATPLSLKASATELGAAPPVELVAHDCGHGWHRQHWRDHLPLALGSMPSVRWRAHKVGASL